MGPGAGVAVAGIVRHHCRSLPSTVVSEDESTPERGDDFGGDETVARPPMAESRPRARLVVLGPSGGQTHALPQHGGVTLGRSTEATITVDDPLVSRVHLELSVTEGGECIRVRDLGSSNGTRVRGETVRPDAPRVIDAGDFVEFGNCTLVIQVPAEDVARRRRFNHGYFELRLEEECQRTRDQGGEFAVVRLQFAPGADAELVERRISRCLGPADLVAVSMPGEYELLAFACSPGQAEELRDRLETALSDAVQDLRVGTACLPRDAQAPDELLALADPAADAAEAAASVGPGDMVLVDPAMRRLYQLVDRVAPSDLSVLILGETGSGKEVLARALHDRSNRAEGPFVPLNCGAFPLELLESELFGHEKGAFTGAHREKLGLLEQGSGGTVFLDELGEMPLPTQVKFLRVIEDRTVRRVGGLNPIAIDVRFVAATHRNLEQAVREGRFREDLYYRLSGMVMHVPPLRERVSEIEVLAHAFAEAARGRQGWSGRADISKRAMMLLHGYAWPGNLRELKNVMERAVVLAQGARVDEEHLPVDKLTASVIFSEPHAESPRVKPGADAETLAEAPAPGASGSKELFSELEELERQRIVEALARNAGNQTRTAKDLGISRKVLMNRLDRYGIDRPRKRAR